MPDCAVGLIVIDSISSFYWQDRFSAGDASRDNGLSENRGLSHPLLNVLSALRDLHLAYRPLVVLTDWTLYPETSHTGHISAYKQHLRFLPTFGDEGSSVTLADATTSVPIQLTHRVSLVPTTAAALANSGMMVDSDIVDSLENKERSRNECKIYVRTSRSWESCRFTMRVESEGVLLSA